MRFSAALGLLELNQSLFGLCCVLRSSITIAQQVTHCCVVHKVEKPIHLVLNQAEPLIEGGQGLF